MVTVLRADTIQDIMIVTFTITLIQKYETEKKQPTSRKKKHFCYTFNDFMLDVVCFVDSINEKKSFFRLSNLNEQ